LFHLDQENTHQSRKWGGVYIINVLLDRHRQRSRKVNVYEWKVIDSPFGLFGVCKSPKSQTRRPSRFRGPFERSKSDHLDFFPLVNERKDSHRPSYIHPSTSAPLRPRYRLWSAWPCLTVAGRWPAAIFLHFFFFFFFVGATAKRKMDLNAGGRRDP
jgi:hypothetical protein